MLKFFLFVLLACAFHRTSGIFIIAYFFNKRFSGDIIIISLVVVYILNPFMNQIFFSAMQIMPDIISSKLNFYLSDKHHISTSSIVFGSLKRALIFIPLYYNRNKLEKIHEGFNLMLNLYFFSLIIYVLFNDSLQIFVSRGNLYFGVLFEVFLIPFLIVLTKKNGSHFITYFFIILFSFITLYKSISPSKDLFVPYKNILINNNLITSKR
jgi:hypothetical protein